jgi:hypothetical protein
MKKTQKKRHKSTNKNPKYPAPINPLNVLEKYKINPV